MNRNKWLLIQLGSNNHYWISTYTNRKTAEKEAKRTEKYGVICAIVNLDELMSITPQEKDHDEDQ